MALNLNLVYLPIVICLIREHFSQQQAHPKYSLLQSSGAWLSIRSTSKRTCNTRRMQAAHDVIHGSICSSVAGLAGRAYEGRDR